MLEVVSTRHNPLVDPALHLWGWEIPVYLFLGGWVAGMMVLSGLLLLQGRSARRGCACFAMPPVALALLSAGMLALLLDLEHELYAWRLYVAFEPASPMSWGAWILLLVYPVLLALSLVRPPAPILRLVPAAEAASRWLGRPGVLRRLAVLSITAGVALGIYTGILLSALGARPFWSSAILGPLFLASGLSSAAAFAHATARDPEERLALARVDNGFLAAELALLALFLVGLANGGEAQRAAAALVLGGPYTAVFWVAVIGLGIVLPLAIQSLAVSRRIRHTLAGPLLVLAGGLALRFVFVYAGQASRWPGV